ncbi:hypothetical protein, partial [Acinetobacter baumannii]
YSYIHFLKVKVLLNESKERCRFHFTYKAVEIKKTDNIQKLRSLLEQLDENFSLKGRESFYLSNYDEDYSSVKFKDALFIFNNLE